MSIRRAMTSLIVGTAATCLVAWCAMFVPRGNAWYGPPATEDLGLFKGDDGVSIWQISRGKNAWHTVVSYWWMQVSGMGLSIPTSDYDARRYDFRQLPRHFRPASLSDNYMQAWYHETGWPLPALTCSVRWVKQVRNADIEYGVRGGVQLPRDADFNPRAMPLVPVWPGFAVDVLVWGGAWYLAATAASRWRRGRRARAGRCSRCGYLLTGLPPGSACPECGP